MGDGRQKWGNCPHLRGQWAEGRNVGNGWSTPAPLFRHPHIAPPLLYLLPKLWCGPWGKIFAGNGSQLDPSAGAAQLLTKSTQQWGEDISRHKCRKRALFRHPPIATSGGGEA
ncbi:hypothetical protein niasHS_007113 [Heterodera schachtii]|uniref:Uncharacterized protein n=1 Tax=Heterodera schachtii TaxID=97005 RepID=A0ABD2JL14_HETSC